MREQRETFGYRVCGMNEYAEIVGSIDTEHFDMLQRLGEMGMEIENLCVQLAAELNGRMREYELTLGQLENFQAGLPADPVGGMVGLHPNEVVRLLQELREKRTALEHAVWLIEKAGGFPVGWSVDAKTMSVNAPEGWDEAVAARSGDGEKWAEVLEDIRDGVECFEGDRK